MKIKMLIAALILFTELIKAQTVPAGATVKSKISVPQSMKAAPYNVDQYALIPENFSLSVYARIRGARFMAIAPNGDLLVSMPDSGRVKLVRPNPSGDPILSNFVNGLARPHDIVFHTIDATTYVYISEKNQINRYKYVNGDLTAHDREIVVSGLPDASLAELKGSYGHELKNIAIDNNHKLYISIASTCNACLEDTKSDPLRGAIYQYDADGKNRKLFAKGIRNAEGLAFVPGTNDLWVVINNRDQIIYPYEDATQQYGKLVTSFVDDNPPEEFTKVVEGGNYGWPFCNPNKQAGFNDMPFDYDYELNKSKSDDCSKMNKINKGINAHSAPLGLLFSQKTKLAAPYNNGAIIALHGSWNRKKATGYKVIFFPWNDATQTPGEEVALIDGFLVPDSSTNTNNNNTGRPVDIAIDLQGNLFISDDAKGTILKLKYEGVTATDEAESNDFLILSSAMNDGKINAFIETKFAGMAKVSLVSAQGTELFETTRMLGGGQNTVVLNPVLNPGVYFLKVSTGNIVRTLKIPVTQ